MQEHRSTVLTLPNALSLLRLLLIPLLVILFKNANTFAQYLPAGAVLIISCLTDFADGMIARKMHSCSLLGMILDPIADKAMQIVLAGCLSHRFPAMRTVFLFLIVKELIQASAGIYSVKHGIMLSGALPEGKAATTVLFISLIALVVCPKMHYSVSAALAWVDIFFLAVSLLRYLQEYYHRFHSA